MDCPDGRCDGSGFLYEEEKRRAYPCSCRPIRQARKRAAAVAGRIPKAFREVSCEREPLPSIQRAHPHVVREVRQYCDSVTEQLAAGRGMWFTGDFGTGKTTLAMLISKTAMERDHTVAIYSLPRLLTMLRETFRDDSAHSLSQLMDKLCSVDLLHIDDVGAEQTTSWVLEQLYTVVNTRYEDERSLILTTNLIKQERRKPAHVAGRRVGRAPGRRAARPDRRPDGLAPVRDVRRPAADVRQRPPAGEAVQRPGAGGDGGHAGPVRRRPLGRRQPALRAAAKLAVEAPRSELRAAAAADGVRSQGPP